MMPFSVYACLVSFPRYYYLFIKNIGHVTLHCIVYPHLGSDLVHMLVLIAINQETKFEVPIFTRPKDVIGPRKFS